MKTNIFKSFLNTLFSVLLFISFVSCTALADVSEGYWVAFTVVTLGVMLFFILRVSNSGTEHKA